MTTYYIKPSGSDAANGTSYATAWQTIGKALGASGIASGDTVYIAPGTYREVVTVAMTSAVATTSIIGDVDGSHTDGVGGDVVWTAYTTSDVAAPNASPPLTLNARDYLSFQNIRFVGGQAQVVLAGAGSTNISFTDCTCMLGPNGTAAVIAFTGTADTAAVWRITRCMFVGSGVSGAAITVAGPTSTTADYDLDFIIDNCIFSNIIGNITTLTTSGSDTFKPGGVVLTRCTAFGGSAYVNVGASWSQKIPAAVLNCFLTGANLSNAFTTNTVNTLIEENNIMSPANTGTTVNGTNSKRSLSYAPMLEFGREQKLGKAPRPFYTPTASSPLLGFGNVEVAMASAGTIANDNAVGSVAWNNPTNASYPDGSSYAVTDAIAQNALSNWLKFTNFGFAIPSTATIVGVRIDIKQLASAASSISLNGNNAGGKLVKAGTIGGTLQTLATNWPTSDGFAISVGGPASLWGQTLTYSDVNDSTFGVAIAVTNSNAATRTASVDYLRMMVFYTDTAKATDFLNRPRPAGGGSTAWAVGALERHDTAAKETSTVDGGSGSAIKLTGPGDQDIKVAVNAAATTISIKVRVDAAASHASPPQAILLANGEIGVSTETKTATPLDNAWETLTFSAFTPTAKGVVTIRLTNRSSSGSGVAYYDTLAIV